MKALYNISYGIYILTAKGDKNNGCVINTLMQVTSNPCRISITVNKDNYTTKMIEKTGEFNVSILDTMTKFDLIQRFGFSSGKDVDKFDGFDGFAIAKNNIPYITSHTNSYLSAKVVSKTDVGTHITFVADVTEDVVLRETEPIISQALNQSQSHKQKEFMFAEYVVMFMKGKNFHLISFVRFASMGQSFLTFKETKKKHNPKQAKRGRKCIVQFVGTQKTQKTQMEFVCCVEQK